MREIRTLRAMWRALETGPLYKVHAPALDPTRVPIGADFGYGLWSAARIRCEVISAVNNRWRSCSKSLW